MSELKPMVYELTGVSVEVYRVPDANHYCARIELHGTYPGEGKIAHNKGRKETLHWREGTATITLNYTVYQLEPRARITMNDGDRYILEGQGKGVVFVRDEPNGTTQIEDLNTI